VRLGGDEFMALLPECRAEEVRHVLARIEGLEFEFNEEKISLHFSRGWTDYKAGETPQELLNRADQELYANKRAGKRVSSPVPSSAVPQSISS
jgi:diguanylate cyclase